MGTELGKLTLDIDQDQLRRVIADGRIAEFTSALSQLAAEQIPAQVVDHLARAASGLTEGGSGAAVHFDFVWDEGGGFGTKPHLVIFHGGPVPQDPPER